VTHLSFEFNLLEYDRLTNLVVGVAPISQSDFDQINLYAQYAAAGYCEGNSNYEVNPSQLLNCTGAFALNGNQSNCPLVEQAGASTVIKFNTG
jgi:hypothetical protein